MYFCVILDFKDAMTSDLWNVLVGMDKNAYVGMLFGY